MSNKIGIFGLGPVGAGTLEQLRAAGREVVVAQRSDPAALPEGVEFRRCDALDAASVSAAVAGRLVNAVPDEVSVAVNVKSSDPE